MAGLPKQPAVFPFAEGLDTKTDDKQTPAGKLTVAENVVFNKAGQIARRRGHRILSREIEGSASEIEACEGVITHNDELLLFTGRTAYSYAEATQRWVSRGTVISLEVSERDVVRNTYQQSNPDVAHLRGMECVAWEDSRGGVRYSILDTTTGTALVSDAQLAATASKPRVVAFQSDFAVFYADGGNIRYKRISAITPTSLGAAVNPVTTMHATENHYDVGVVGERLFIAFGTLAGEIGVTYIDNLWTLSGPSITRVPMSGSPACLSVFGDDVQNVWVAAGSTSNAEAVCFTYALSTTVVTQVALESAIDVRRVAGVFGDGVACVFYEIYHATASRASVRKNTVTTAGVIGTAASVRRSVGLVGDAFHYNETFFAPVAHESTLQATTFVVTSSGDIVARVAAGVSNGLRTNSTVSNTFSADDDGSYTMASLRKSLLETEAGVVFMRLGVTLPTFDFTATARYKTARAGGVTILAGGIIRMYDGGSFVEHGFHLYPEVVTDPVAVVGGGSLTAGTYQVVYVYEQTDRTGRIHRSAPSPAKSVTVALSGQITHTIPTLRLTDRPDVRLVVYRTLADGEIFYRVTSSVSPTLNDTTADLVTLTEGTADATIRLNDWLYTTGEVVANVEPDACSAICTRAGRVIVAGMSDPDTFAFSKLVEEGEPAAFADEFRQPVDAVGGRITALATLDDKTLIFKRNAIYVHTGDGPNEVNEQSDYGDPKLLSTDVGCSEPASVVLTPLGVFFKSTKGFYLVDQGNGVSFIGAAVEDWNAYEVTGAALVPNTNRVVFVTSEGPALVYDYLFQQWSTFTNHSGVGCTVWRDQFVFARSSGEVLVADDTTHADGDVGYRLKVVRAWMSLAGLMGFKRLYEFAILGEYKGGHKLRVAVGYDFNETFTEEDVLDAEDEFAGSPYGTGVYGAGTPYGGEWPEFGLRYQPGRQLCTSFRVLIEEAQTQDFNEALTLSSLTCVIGVVPGLKNLRASRLRGTA